MILAALNEYYQRLVRCGTGEIPPYGYSNEKISYALVISVEGKLLDVHDIRDTSEKKPKPTLLSVPQPKKRSVDIAPCFLWDKTDYVLGVSLKVGDRTIAAHQKFKEYHEQWLSKDPDLGLQALLKFLLHWTPEKFATSGKFNQEMLGSNFVFRLEGELGYIHDRAAAKQVQAQILESQKGEEGFCLVSNQWANIARLHPSIKGISNAQSSGVSIVSFNQDSFDSYGKLQGENAPVSEEVTFAYTTALNYLLRFNSRHKLQIGDATVVFWALAPSDAQAEQAESLFAALLSPHATDASETNKLHSALNIIRQGKPLTDLNPNLEGDTRLFILGLSPNISRLSIRYWETANLNEFAKRLAQHYYDLSLEPAAWHSEEPSVWRLLLETVPHHEKQKPRQDDIQPLLAGELMRAILTGGLYPQSLLTTIIMRFRADGDISGLRVALCKAVLARQERLRINQRKQEVWMSLDLNNTDPGYLLGRLFAELENAQKSALGNINATICDRYYGAASAAPASLFPLLLRNAQHHLAKLRKDKGGIAYHIEQTVEEIVDKLGTAFPKYLNLEAQGHFAIGYYHQSKVRFNKIKTDDNTKGEIA